MPKFAAALLLLSVSALPAGVFDRSPDPLKCPSRVGGDPDMPASIILLDNEVFDGRPEQLYPWAARTEDEAPETARVPISTFEEHGPLHSVEIVCWRWVEAHFGVQVRLGASYTLTKAWVEQTRNDRIAALEAVVSAQTRHRQLTGEYTARVEDLPGFGALSDYGLPAHLQLDLTATSNGWAARLQAKESWSNRVYTHVSPLYDCVAFEGEAPREWETIRAEGRLPEERIAACFGR